MILTPRSKDLLTILEAAYAEATDEEAWLSGVLAAAGPWIDQGRGVMAHRYLQSEDELRLGDVQASGDLDPAFAEAANAWSRRVEASWSAPGFRQTMRSFYPRVPLVSTINELTQLEGEDAVKLLDESHSMAPPDSFRGTNTVGILAGNPSGHGCLLFSHGVKPKLTRGARTLWTQIATHIAAGYRLVVRETSVGAPLEPSAVLEPSGRVHHLGPDAAAERETLSRAVRAVDRARGKLRRTDPQEAVALWKGLVAGQWTLVDQIDHDGRRFVVARRNAPEGRAWQTLNASELAVLSYAAHGQSHKLIAYELGLTVTGVARRFVSAARKVGAASRIELVTAYRSAMMSDPPPSARRMDIRLIQEGPGATVRSHPRPSRKRK
jgi:hypothetical protein